MTQDMANVAKAWFPELNFLNPDLARTPPTSPRNTSPDPPRYLPSLSLLQSRSANPSKEQLRSWEFNVL
jgi:hypothetical protein